MPPSLPLPDRVTRDFLVHHHLCPAEVLPDGDLAVAVSERSLVEGLDDLSIAYGRRVVPRECTEEEVEVLIERLTAGGGGDVEVALGGDVGDPVAADVRDLANQAPVIRYVNLLIREAYAARASDIHVESTRLGLRPRFRIDGVLQPGLEVPAGLDRAIVSRIKLLADLDIAERRRPQDGRIRARLADRELDLRVSTVPTMFGESVVLRLLEMGDRAIELGELGLAPDLLAAMTRLARLPHGMVLATGPTGSGKTTTLYAALGLRDSEVEKIVTLEDPVEYALAGVTQVPVHVQAGVTFASALRSILRQDPDVVMVGEMRDTETADLAVQAALTGHVVLSTLHTNDAVGAIPRLLDLGVPPYLICATLDAILAQRLVRRVCPECREEIEPDLDTLATIDHGGTPRDGHPTFVRGRGCASCRGTGYRGRTGVFELFEITDKAREAISRRASRAELAALGAEGGMRTLRMDGWAKACAGVTTLQEVLRATGSEAFTLIEMIVVMAIIGTLAMLVGPSVLSHVGTANITTAQSQIETFSVALDAYRLDTGQYPTTAEGLTALRTQPTDGNTTTGWRGPYLRKRVPNDPWGRPYIYVSPGRYNPQSYDLYTLGKDGTPGGGGEDADITSWGDSIVSPGDSVAR